MRGEDGGVRGLDTGMQCLCSGIFFRSRSVASLQVLLACSSPALSLSLSSWLRGTCPGFHRLPREQESNPSLFRKEPQACHPPHPPGEWAGAVPRRGHWDTCGSPFVLQARSITPSPPCSLWCGSGSGVESFCPLPQCCPLNTHSENPKPNQTKPCALTLFVLHID